MLQVSSPKPPAKKKKESTSSSGSTNSESGSTEETTSSDDGVITIHLNERAVSLDSSDSSEDSKGKGKEKDRLDPKKVERKRLEQTRLAPPLSSFEIKNENKWRGSNEVFLLTPGNDAKAGGKPLYVCLWDELIQDPESKDRTRQELYPSFPAMHPSVVRREVREKQKQDQRRTESINTYTPYAAEIRQLADMGFTDKSQILELLAQYDGNVANVVNRLLG